MTALLSALGVVFVAELGDKTQLVAMSFGARYSLRHVFAGLAIAYAVSAGLAALVGGALGAALPDRPLAIGGGILFIIFGLFELRRARHPDDRDDEAPDAVDGRMRSPVLLVATAVTVAELGDKTQLATATLAADSGDPVFTWIGATLGLIAAGAVGVVVGRFLGDRIPRSTLSYVSGGLFLAVGVVMVVTAL